MLGGWLSLGVLPKDAGFRRAHSRSRRRVTSCKPCKRYCSTGHALGSATPMSGKEPRTGVPMAEPAKPEPGSVQIVGVALVAVWARAMLRIADRFGF